MSYRYLVPVFLAAAILRTGLASVSPDDLQVAQDPMAIYTAEVDLKTGAVLSAPARLATPLKNSWLPQYSKDGRRLAFLSSDVVVDARDQRSPAQQVVTRPQPVLSVRSLGTGQTTSLPLKLNQVFAFDWSPDGRTFVLRTTDLGGGYSLHLLDAATGDVTPLAIGKPGEVRYLSSQWTGEGRRLFYMKGRPGVVSDGNPLVERDLDSGDERVFLNWSEVKTADGTPFGLRQHMVSPDRRMIAGWTGEGFTNGKLFVVQLDTKSPRELMRANGNPYPISGLALAWTADSRAVVINRPEGPEVNTRRSLWVVPIDGSAPVKLAIDLPIQNLPPSIHPDGRRIAFVSGGAPR